jgi:CRISPR/Cas system-associated exonuclease Cas4 (RecB family)
LYAKHFPESVVTCVLVRTVIVPMRSMPVDKGECHTNEITIANEMRARAVLTTMSADIIYAFVEERNNLIRIR